MSNKDLKQRTFDFAIENAKMIALFPYNTVNKAYFNQLIRSSSSVGANYPASQRAKSDSDFINKLKIVEEEADETIHFLQLLLALNETFANVIEPLIKEGSKILKIIVRQLTRPEAELIRQKLSSFHF